MLVKLYPGNEGGRRHGPGGIDIGGVAGSLGLISKQARELGYQGIVYAAQWTTPEAIEVAGEGAVSLHMNSVDWG